VCVCVFVCVCEWVCVFVCVCASVRVFVLVFFYTEQRISVAAHLTCIGKYLFGVHLILNGSDDGVFGHSRKIIQFDSNPVLPLRSFTVFLSPSTAFSI
jgi:hypothetical protein